MTTHAFMMYRTWGPVAGDRVYYLLSNKHTEESAESSISIDKAHVDQCKASTSSLNSPPPCILPRIHGPQMKNCCFKQESILRNSKLNICKIESFLNPEITWYLKNYKANSFVTQQSLLRRDLQTTIYIYIYTHTHTHTHYIRICLQNIYMGFPSSSDSKVSACIAGDPGSIPGLERSPGVGNGYPLQYSCLENSMDKEDWWAMVQGVTKSWT